MKQFFLQVIVAVGVLVPKVEFSFFAVVLNLGEQQHKRLQENASCKKINSSSCRDSLYNWLEESIFGVKLERESEHILRKSHKRSIAKIK